MSSAHSELFSTRGVFRALIVARIKRPSNRDLSGFFSTAQCYKVSCNLYVISVLLMLRDGCQQPSYKTYYMPFLDLLHILTEFKPAYDLALLSCPVFMDIVKAIKNGLFETFRWLFSHCKKF